MHSCHESQDFIYFMISCLKSRLGCNTNRLQGAVCLEIERGAPLKVLADIEHRAVLPRIIEVDAVVYAEDGIPGLLIDEAQSTAGKMPEIAPVEQLCPVAPRQSPGACIGEDHALCGKAP